MISIRVLSFLYRLFFMWLSSADGGLRVRSRWGHGTTTDLHIFVYLFFILFISLFTEQEVERETWKYIELQQMDRRSNRLVLFYWNTFFFFPASVYVKNEKCENVGWLASAELLNRVSRSLAHSCSGWYIKFAGIDYKKLFVNVKTWAKNILIFV